MELFLPLNRMKGMDTELTPALGLGRLEALSDQDLLDRMKRIAAAERAVGVYALSHLAEIRRRKLFEEAGYPTMFAYCVGELKYSEATAYRRLQSVDAVRRFPEVLSMIKDGAVTVCALSVIAKYLNGDNSERLLRQIAGKSLRDVERLAIEFAPRPDTQDVIRAVPAPAPVPAPSEAPAPVSAAPQPAPSESVPVIATTPSQAPQRDRIIPRSSDRSLFSFTGSEELRRVIARLREILWHKYPEGRLEDIMLEAGNLYLAMKDPQRKLPSKPRPPRQAHARFSPRWVKSAVYRRDGGQCTFLNGEGLRCESRRALEYDHVKPWSQGGRSDDPKNIRLLCRTHNQLAARRAGLA